MRYAKAMIEYAQEKGVEDRVYQEFLTLSHSFCAQPGLREALDNPVIAIKEKLALVCTAADGEGTSTREFIRFITLVLKNRREGYLQFIGLMYLDLYRKLKHIGVGKLITAVDVDKATSDRIRSAAAHILHAQMELETVVDPSIEGGIAIIDYDAGNIKSVEKSLNYLGEEAIITRDHDEIVNSDKVILPGVGAFADAMEKIRHYGLEETIHEVVEKNIPFLGICLGLQLMFESSDEGPGVKGLGLLPGKILRIPKSGDLKIPHMGWNNIKVKEDSRLFKELPENPYVYFVHSYYLLADDEDIVAATTEYGVKIHAAVEKDNIFACQFHPEKSSTVGLQILKNFVSL